MSSEVGSGTVAIFPTFKGFRRQVSSEVDGATKAGAASAVRGFRGTGAAAGKAFNQSLSAVLKSASADVAKASRGVSTARLAEQNAAGKVRIAETQLAEVRKKYAADSSQVVRAEERLASAQRARTAIVADLKTASTTLTSAQQRLAAAQKAAGAAGTQSAAGIRSAFSGLGSVFSGVGRTISSSLGSAFTATVGVATTAAKAAGAAFLGVGAAVTAGLAAAGAAGFKRLSSIETAQAKLKALGNTNKAVATIMANANAAVIGTQYSLADAVTGAAAAVAAGIKPGKQLEAYLKTTANAAAVAGVNFNDLGLVMNQVQAQNKAYTQDLNQVASRGIPIYAALQKVYGTNRDGLRKMLQAGEVDAAHFQRALKIAVGDSAVAVGNTTVGSAKNMGAAFSRFGAGLLTGVFPVVKSVFKTITSGFDSVTPAITRVSTALAPVIRKAVLPVLAELTTKFDGFKNRLDTLDVTAFAARVGAGFDAVKQTVGSVLSTLGPALTQIGPSLLSTFQTVGPALASAFQSLAPVLVQVIPQLATAAKDILPALAQAIVAVAPALPPLASGLAQLAPIIVVLVRDAIVPLINSSAGLVQLFGVITQGGFTTQVAVDGMAGKFGILAQVAAAVGISVGGALGNLIGSAVNMAASVGGAVTRVIGFFVRMQGSISAAVGGAIAGLFSFAVRGVAAAGRLQAGITQAIGRAILAIAGLPGRAQAALGNLSGRLFASGAALIGGFVRGIQSKVGEVTGAVGSVLAKAKNFFPNSPAKEGPFSGKGWTYYSGAATGRDYAAGLDSQKSAISRSSTAAMRAASITAQAVNVSGSGRYESTSATTLRPVMMDASLIQKIASGEAVIVQDLQNAALNTANRMGARRRRA